MAEDVVLYEVVDRVALVTLNRPERLNALIPGMSTAYYDCLEKAGADPEVGAIVVTGAGRGFCAGADLGYLPQASTVEAARTETRDGMFPLSVPKLMVGAINGACIGIGLSQALMFDVRFAAHGAKFSTAFARRGLIAEAGASALLPRLVGTSAALDLLLSGRMFLTDEALALCLVNRVCEPEALVQEALAYGRDVAINCSPASVAAIKSQVYRHFAMDAVAAGQDSEDIMLRSLEGPDLKEGVSAFLEHRTPRFAPLGQGTDLSYSPPGGQD
jgi:enoyl-CoA hydratase/carnithine racemase